MPVDKECGYCIPELNLTQLEVILHNDPTKQSPQRNTLVWEVCMKDVKCMKNSSEYGRVPRGLWIPDFTETDFRQRGGHGSSLAGNLYGYVNLRIYDAPDPRSTSHTMSSVSFFPTGNQQGPGTQPQLCSITGDGIRPDGALSDGRGELICCKAFGGGHPLANPSWSPMQPEAPAGGFRDCCDFALAKMCRCGSKSRAPKLWGIAHKVRCCFRGIKDIPFDNWKGTRPQETLNTDLGTFTPIPFGAVKKYLNDNKDKIKEALQREICSEINGKLEACNVSGKTYPPPIPRATGVEPVVIGKEGREPFDLNCRCTGIEDKKCSSLGYWLT